MWSGSKPFEVRRDDRGFAPGDVLHLREWDPSSSSYTGHELTARVTYVLRGGALGIEDGYVVMGIERMQRSTSGRVGAV